MHNNAAAFIASRALAGAYAKNNVRVNAICAGRILTERITNNYGTPDKAGVNKAMPRA